MTNVWEVAYVTMSDHKGVIPIVDAAALANRSDEPTMPAINESSWLTDARDEDMFKSWEQKNYLGKSGCPVEKLPECWFTDT